MNIETLRLIYDLMESQNFSKTAKKIGISQSAVSQQLAQLEMRHNCQFFDRKTRPIEPTPEGRALYRAARDILERYDGLVSELRDMNKSHGRINIGAIFSIGMYSLQPYVSYFMSNYPNTNVSVQYSSYLEIYRRVLKGELDLGIIAYAKSLRDIDVYPFVEEPLKLVTAPDHRFADMKKVDIHKLSGEDFIAFEKEVPTRQLIDEILDRYNVKPRIIQEFDNTETIKRAVEIGAGVSILPETTLQTEVKNRTLKATDFEQGKMMRPTNIIARKGKSFSRLEKTLLKLLEDTTFKETA